MSNRSIQPAVLIKDRRVSHRLPIEREVRYTVIETKKRARQTGSGRTLEYEQSRCLIHNRIESARSGVCGNRSQLAGRARSRHSAEAGGDRRPGPRGGESGCALDPKIRVQNARPKFVGATRQTAVNDDRCAARPRSSSRFGSSCQRSDV